MTTTAGSAYDAVVLGPVRDDDFDLDDYCADLEQQLAAEEMPQLGRFANELRSADVIVRRPVTANVEEAP